MPRGRRRASGLACRIAATVRVANAHTHTRPMSRVDVGATVRPGCGEIISCRRPGGSHFLQSRKSPGLSTVPPCPGRRTAHRPDGNRAGTPARVRGGAKGGGQRLPDFFFLSSDFFLVLEDFRLLEASLLRFAESAFFSLLFFAADFFAEDFLVEDFLAPFLPLARQ